MYVADVRYGGRALTPQLSAPESPVAYETSAGTMLRGTAETNLRTLAQSDTRAQLIFTSPPFPLNSKKRYGNLQGPEYIEWLASFAPLFKQVLHQHGSIVIELGNAWESGRPAMSPLAIRALLAFLDRGDFVLCQQFVVHNPARLPSPAQWVTVERIRVKDAYTNVWWMALSDRPKANNRNVLQPYSPRMQSLLRSGAYNSGLRPSEHTIGERSFLKDNGGAIPSNVLTFSNTASTDEYQHYCRIAGLPTHPARMPKALADFFIAFLTDPGDVVLDPFAGSNTTGSAAERLGRHWISIEPNEDYVDGSRGRFSEPALK